MGRSCATLLTLVFALAARAVLAQPAGTAPAFDEAFIRQFAATYGFRLGTPQEITIAPDGDVLFTRTGPRSFVGDLYERDADSGKVRQILDAETLLGGGEEQLSAEEKARRERMRKATRGIGGFELSQDGGRLLVPLSDRLFVVERGSGKVAALDTGAGFPFDPQLSPAADRVAFVVDGDLWVVDAEMGAKPRRLTTRPSHDRRARRRRVRRPGGDGPHARLLVVARRHAASPTSAATSPRSTRCTSRTRRTPTARRRRSATRARAPPTPRSRSGSSPRPAARRRGSSGTARAGPT